MANGTGHERDSAGIETAGASLGVELRRGAPQSAVHRLRFEPHVPMMLRQRAFGQAAAGRTPDDRVCAGRMFKREPARSQTLRRTRESRDDSIDDRKLDQGLRQRSRDPDRHRPRREQPSRDPGRPFTWRADLPPALGGTNQAPSPTALLLSALAGCAVVFVRDTLAPQLEDRVTSVEATVKCDTDGRGLLGMTAPNPTCAT